MVGHPHAAIDKAPGREIAVIAREAILDRKTKQGLVTRGRNLRGIGQSVRVSVDGPRHTQGAGLARHQLGEFFLGAGKMFGDHDGCVVGGFRHQCLDRILDHQGLTRADAEFGRRLACGVGRNFHLGVEFDPACLELLEQQIQCHYLGERSRVADRVGVSRMQYVAGIGVDHDIGIAWVGGRGRGHTAFDGFALAARVSVCRRQGNGCKGEGQHGNTTTQPERGFGRYAKHGHPFSRSLGA